MYEATLLIYAVAIVASCYLGLDAFKHRFLPIAQPLVYFNIVLILMCIVGFIETLTIAHPQWLGQFLQDFRAFLLRPLCVPLWVWTLLEYHKDKKVSPTHKLLLLCFIIPLLTITIAIVHIVGQGFTDPTSTTALISPDTRAGSDYILPALRLYGAIVALSAILLTPYLVKNRQQSQYPRLEATLVIFLTLIPFSFYQLHQRGVLDITLGAPMMIFVLLWGSRQYRLLDALPVALQGIMDKVDSGILVSNMQSRLLYVNDYAKQLFHLETTPEKLQQRALSIPVTFTQHFDFSQPEKQNALLQTKNKDGELRYIDAILQPIFHPKLNKHIGSSVSLHDITERKQAELELQNFNRQKSEFFAGISHEFRTPLTLSMGNIDDVLNESDKMDSPQRQALHQAKDNNQRLLGLVNQLLELSRLDRGALSIQPAKLQLSSYLPMLIANFESLAERQNIQLHFIVDAEASQDSVAYFDPDALDKVVINLVSNALKSITDDAGGHVYLTLSHADHDRLQLEVRDTGCGIATDAISKIFDMFYSHQMNNSAWPPGTGVGLSLVKQLLVLHDGDISASSIKNEGSCFTVSLRRGYAHFADDIAIDHEDDWAQTLGQEGSTVGDYAQAILPPELLEHADEVQEVYDHTQLENSTSVLLAEDNPDMRRYIRKHLTGFNLLEAPDGEAALALARQEVPDLILSDVMMPKMNGYDLCKRLKSDAETSHIPVVLLTAKSDQAEKLEGLSLGADDYLSKPFDVRELNLRIHNLIKARQSIQTCYQEKGLEEVISHPELSKRETKFLETLRTYVQANIENTDIKITDLAETVYMSERSLSRKLKALTGETPKKMLITIRLAQAAKLLTESDDNITSLSYQVGFSDPSHFTRSFKTHYGVTPTQYRERE